VPTNAKSDRVIRVTDGDTIVLASLGRTRLIGVDTPEVYGRVECYGREASRFTKHELPIGTAVRFVRGVEGTDRYGRALAYVWAGGEFMNGTLVQQGYAVPLTIPPNVEYAELFRRLARRARSGGSGLWSASTCAGDDDRPVDGGNGSAVPDPKPTRRTGGSKGTTADKDCSDFATHDEAQRFFEQNGGPGSDRHRLDANHDGKACESLP
jgi:micrococcal nuclease